MPKKTEVTEENKSFAMELAQTYKGQAKMWFVCWLITFIAFIGLVVYMIYTLNDLAIIETTEVTQEAETGINNYNSIGNDGEIING